MNVIEIVILAVALALDAMIVSFSYGLILRRNRLYYSLVLSLFFGFFQFFMPVIGWFLTGCIYKYLNMYSKWIVCFVFFCLGIKFLKEAFSNKEELKITCISFLCIIGLSFATSIDALGAGVSLRFLNESVLPPALIIGVITMLLSLFGFSIACIFSKMESKYIEITGALLLIYLALKSINIL